MSESTHRGISRDDALLWLTDRHGKQMHLSVRAVRGDDSFRVLSAIGELDHWSASTNPLAGETGVALRKQLIGLYVVGGCDFDISDPDSPFEFSLRERGDRGRESQDDELVIDLGTGVEIGIMRPTTDVPMGDA
jgi:hypothetical protein